MVERPQRRAPYGRLEGVWNWLASGIAREAVGASILPELSGTAAFSGRFVAHLDDILPLVRWLETIWVRLS